MDNHSWGKIQPQNLGSYILIIRNLESGIVQQITDTKSKLKAKYPECFEGLGKLKDFLLKIAIDENVKPVLQPLR